MEEKNDKTMCVSACSAFPFPIQRLICSALQHAECQVAAYLLSMFHYVLSMLVFFIVISIARDKHLLLHGH